MCVGPIRAAFAGALFLALAGPARAQLVVNEIHFEPADGPAGNANGDAIRSSLEDEFVEIVNVGAVAVDVSGYVIEDAASFPAPDYARHLFPAGTVVAPGQAVVVFGGGTPSTVPGAFGDAVVQVARPAGIVGGGLSLNDPQNGLGDAVYLVDGAGAVVAQADYGGDAAAGASVARAPDVAGTFVAHTSIASNPVLFSPGQSNTGSGFVGASEDAPAAGALSLRFVNPARGTVRIGYTLPDAAGPARLAVYDVRGRRVAVLVDGGRGAGETALEAGRLPPGVYFLRIEAGADALTRRLAVAR